MGEKRGENKRIQFLIWTIIGIILMAGLSIATTTITETSIITTGNLSTAAIGIGTSTPSNVLDVRGTGNFSGLIYINNGTLVGDTSMNSSTNIINLVGNMTTAAILMLRGNISSINTTANIQNLINNTFIRFAKIGINQLSGEGYLEINVSQNISGLWVHNMTSANTYLYINGTSGFIGIGTNVPTHALNVVGNSNITGFVNMGGNVTIYGNVTLPNLMYMLPTTLPICTTNTNHSIGVNGTGLYYCNSSSTWTPLAFG